MNELAIFNHSKFGDIRIIDNEGKPWFMASDVAKALGYKDPSRAVVQHCKKSIKTTILAKRTDGKILPPVNRSIIPESDVYRLIFGSKLPSAEEFQTWVFEEVLPSLRENGSYSIHSDKPRLVEVCENYIKAYYETERLKLEVAEVSQQRDEIGNNFGAGPDFYKVSEIPWLYKIFKPHKRLHQLVGRELSKISNELELDVKTCHVDKNTNWYRAYQKQAIDILYERLLENRWLLSRFRISRRKTIPGQCKISQF